KGMPKARIEEAAARRQAAWDRGEDVVIGVNKYRPAEDDVVETLAIDTAAVRDGQIRRLERVRAERDEATCRAALERLAGGAAGDANLLAFSVEAARARATLGEISGAMEQVFGRYRADQRGLTGVYGAAFADDREFEAIRSDVEAFAEAEGRRPRLLVAKLGQDGHDRGAKVIATAFADIGFDVDIGALFQTPEEAAREAIDNDVHVIGVSSLAAGHGVLVPDLIEELRRQGAGDILVVVGGVVPPADRQALKDAGVAAIYPPGTNIQEAAREIMRLLQSRPADRAA
ncbi:MAG: methylmalonyl-CoA mutase family protein, partial [Geminicoccaceae bacterium]|nr:methylmalonyl-CoA mutase family protein [Geminicoccaceae bacterium]